jgi:hypothetical protein
VLGLGVEKKIPTGYRVVDELTTICSLENCMVLKTKYLLLVLVVLVAVSGCYTKQVRHLASDVALLKIGESTEEDVLIFLGEPDAQQEVSAGVEKWMYSDMQMSLLEKAPLIGKHVGSPEYRQAVVTIKDNIVTEVVYSSSDADDLSWTKDYSWQKNRSDG